MKTKKTLLMLLLVSLGLGTRLAASDSDNTTTYCGIAGSHCLSFGGDDYVDMGNDSSLQLPLGNMSVMSWVQLGSGTEDEWMGICGKMKRSTHEGFVLARLNNNYFHFLRGNGSPATLYGTPSNTVYTDDEWHHVAGVMAGSYSRLYVDGQKQTLETFNNFVASDEAAFVGRHYSDSSDKSFEGLVDDVRFYNRTLSDAEIVTAMTTLPNGPTAVGLVGYWNFNEGSGQNAADSSGYGNHGRLGSSSGSDSKDPQWVDTSLFCGLPPTNPVISGYVRQGGLGLAGVSVSANNGGTSTVTNGAGYYSVTVPYGWTGRVTPQLSGYIFTPSYMDYSAVTWDRPNQHYQASSVPSTPSISGYVRQGGVGLAGVFVSANNGGTSTVTNSSGYYSVTVPYGWTGRVTPQLGGYSFTPSYLEYVTVTTLLSNQNYQASSAPVSPVISGYVRQGSVGLAGVSVSANNGGTSTVTNSSGYYSVTVPYGWTGRVTPQLGGYTFTPSYMDYSAVTWDRPNQHYQASSVPSTPLISGYVSQGSVGLAGVTLVTTNGSYSTSTNGSGYYSLVVPYGWSGRVTPQLNGYTFTPPYIDYSSTTSARPNQHYQASLVPPTVDTYYVDAVNGNDNNTGHSQINAFRTIQRGINATVNGDTVIVLDGLYQGAGNKELDFNGHAITVRSQNGPQSVTIDCQQNGRAFYFHKNEGTDSVLDGFTLTGGNTYQGGAIYCYASSPTITRCVITQNVSSNGGAIYCKSGSAAVISHCMILDNSHSGGVRFDDSAAQLLNCVLADNVELTGAGGAIRCDNGYKQPLIHNCTVVNNVSSGEGGGLWCRYSYVTVTNSIFWGNEASTGGDQMSVSASTTLTVKYSDVEGGQAGVKTGGNLVWGSGNLDVDPLLADPQAGDYHLQSRRGRYWVQENVWLADEQTSPVIDAGNPADAIGDELEPNGGIINMGAYGGTVQASRSDQAECTLVRDEDGNGVIEYPADLFALLERWILDYDEYIAP